MKITNWIEILIFYTIAVLVSAPFRLNLVSFQELVPLNYGFNNVYLILKALGPLVAFIVVVYLIKSKVPRTVSLSGQNIKTSIFAFATIPVCLFVIGLENNLGVNENALGLIFGCSIIVYALFEEIGWRGYLQDALANVSFRRRIFLISIMWYLWHLNFLQPNASLQGILVHYGLVLAGSFGLYFIANRTKSLLVCSAGHALFNIFEIGLPVSQSLIIVAITSIAVIISMRFAQLKR
jgi:uncharacterized protein